MRFDHQIEVIEESWDKKAWAWFLETGTGKTCIACDNIQMLFETGQINAVLVIAPKGVYRKVWQTQLKQWLTCDFMVFSWQSTMNYHQKNMLDLCIDNVFKKPDRLMIFLTNVEAYSHKKIFEPVLRFLNNYKVLGIIDESTRIKNVGAERTKKIHSLKHLFPYKREMTGFPVLNSPQDLYSQATWLGDDLIPFESFYAFRNYFCTMRTIQAGVEIETGTKNLDKLTEMIKTFSSRRLKKDCLDLPPKLYEQVYIEMTVEQKALYKSMKEKAMAELGNGQVVSVANFMTQLSKMHQIANGVLMSPVGDRMVVNDKLDTLVEMLENDLYGSVAIAACYVHNIRTITTKLVERFGKETVSSIDGSTPERERERAIDRFQSGKQRLLVINPSTMREGIDLFYANTCIFYNNSRILDHRIQFEDRFHRIGQTNKVTYIDLLTEDTVDLLYLDDLMNKQDVGSRIMGDGWKRWFN